MTNSNTLDTLLAAWSAGQDAPAELAGEVSMQQAYALQLELLDRHLAEGTAQAGWKLGQTNAALRASRGESEPAPGFLLQQNRFADGSTMSLENADNWYIEPELVFVIGTDIAGQDVTAAEVRKSVAQVAAGFEIVRTWSGWKDRALQRAVNGSTRGFVVGVPTDGCPDAQELDDLKVLCSSNEEEIANVRAGDVNDNPLESTAWLVRFLAAYGLGLTAGQIILTGSYAGLLPMRQEQSWHAAVGELAPISLQTV